MTVLQPRMQYEYITPEIAAGFLARMAPNRNIRPNSVQELVRALQDGTFDPYNGEPGVKVDINGLTFDGQHRLRAIVVSGISTDLLVIRDLRPEAAETTDIGNPRRLADVLRMRHEKSASVLAGAIKGAFRYTHGTLGSPGSGHNPSMTEALAFLKTHPSVREAASSTSRYCSRHKDYGAMLTPQSYSTLWWLYSRYDVDQAEYFFDRITIGDVDKDSPIWVLRRTLTNMRSRKGVFFAGEANHAMAITTKTWNAWNTGQFVQVLKWRPNPNAQAAESFPDPFGKEIIDEVIAKEAADNGYIATSMRLPTQVDTGGRIV